MVTELADDASRMEARMERVVRVIARAASGNFDERLDLGHAVDPFVEVEAGLNVLLDALVEAKARNDAQLLEIDRKNAEIAERQAMALRELATPLITVGDGILALPIIGTVDTERSANMMDALLDRVVAEQASHVIMDLTGVTLVDTRTADHFLRMAKAVRLLGAECFVTGISSTVAQTIAQLGIDTTGVRTLRTLADALRIAQREIAQSRGTGA